VTYYYLPDDLASVDKIASERNYKNRDEIEISPELLPGYEEKVKTFFHEHLHEDEEIRYILAGGGYFDVRSKDDDWVRLRLEKGDLMIMPAGIYHRFTTDDQNVSLLLFFFCCALMKVRLMDRVQYTKAMRLFKEDPKWTPLKRDDAATDSNPFRQEYLKSTSKA
jgi:1,2-dihydroxy-3-keto-5-methylthiopentene dioxygenase